MACSRWVLPRPESPWMKSGLYERAGVSATDSDAAWANRLESPITKASSVKLGLSPAPVVSVVSAASGGQPGELVPVLAGRPSASGSPWLGAGGSAACGTVVPSAPTDGSTTIRTGIDVPTASATTDWTRLR